MYSRLATIHLCSQPRIQKVSLVFSGQNVTIFIPFLLDTFYESVNYRKHESTDIPNMPCLGTSWSIPMFNQILDTILMLCLQLHKKKVLFYTLQWTRRSMYGMYGIFAYIHLVVFMVNVGKYTMHGSYGYVFCTWRPLPSNYVGFSCWMFIDLSTWSSHDKRPDFREKNTNCQPFPPKKKTLRTLFSMVSSTLFRSRPSILGLLFHSKQIFMVR